MKVLNNNKDIIIYLQQNHIINEDLSLNIRFASHIKKKPELAAVIVQATAFLRYSAPIKARLHVIIQGLTEQPLCATCGTPTEMRLDGRFRYTFPNFCGSKCFADDAAVKKKRSQTNIKKYGTESVLKSATIREKIQATTMERYGTEQLFASPEIRERIKQTNIEKYGVENPRLNKEIQERIKQTNIEKYGVECVFQSLEVRERIKQTMLERYGVSNPFESETFQQKADETMLERYGVKSPIESELLKKKVHDTMIERYGHKHFHSSKIDSTALQMLNDAEWMTHQYVHLKKIAKRIAEELKVSISTVHVYLSKHGIDTTIHKGSSQGERDLAEFIRTIYLKPVITNDRDTICPLEVDILLPEQQIAFEYNGIFWHSELNGKDKYYHLNKLKACNSKGIRLIQITDKEWNEKQDIVKSRIGGILGVNQRIYARKTTITKVTNKQAMMFFKDTHIQGAAGCTVAYGLKDESGRLLAVMSFGKSRFNKKVEWELVRYSSMLNTNVVGGASKLFKHFIKNHDPKSVITYSDKRWNTGRMYEELGFTKKPDALPNYYYFLPFDPDVNLLHRVKFQKHKLPNLLETFNPTKTEWENMSANGYDRIWDCGNGVYVWGDEKAE